MNDLSGLEEQLKLLQEIDLNSLKRTGLGVFEFEEAFPQLQQMYFLLSFFGENKDLLKNNVSQEHVDQVTAKVKEFLQVAEGITGFDPKGTANPNVIHKQILDNIRNRQKHILKDLLTLQTYLQVQKMKPEEISKYLGGQRKEIEKMVKELESKNKEAGETLTKIKEISGTAGATVYSEVFKNQAIKHERQAHNWFIGALSILGVIIAYLLFLLFQNPTTNQSFEIVVQNAFVKILFLSTLFYALYQCVRNYNANMHLRVLNQHRQNAIETFEAFANAATTPEVKSAVLMQATQSVFDFNKSGHLSKDNPSGSSPNFVDFFHNLSGK